MYRVVCRGWNVKVRNRQLFKNRLSSRGQRKLSLARRSCSNSDVHFIQYLMCTYSQYFGLPCLATDPNLVLLQLGAPFLRHFQTRVAPELQHSNLLHTMPPPPDSRRTQPLDKDARAMKTRGLVIQPAHTVFRYPTQHSTSTGKI